MDFVTFLNQASRPQFWQAQQSLCFIGNTYPMLFFSMLFKHLEKNGVLPAAYQRLFVDGIEKKALHATLGQSILGAFSFFWLGNVSSEKETKATQEQILFLSQYKGPHYIAYFVSNEYKQVPTSGPLIIQLPHLLKLEEFDLLVTLFGLSFDKGKQAFTKKLLATASSLTPDTACMFLNYLELINTRYLPDYQPMLATLLEATPSLSLLTEYFFAKNGQRFFQLWKMVHKEYPDIFWVIFWSEQLWKAHHVIYFMQQKDFIQAKRMSYRLPYSFINRDWQKVNQAELKNAFSFLYAVDYGIKTGSSFCSFDLFYLTYFTNKFA